MKTELLNEDHVKNRVMIYHDRCKESISLFQQSGYPAILLEAVYFYGIMRDYALQFEIDYPEWDVIYNDAKEGKGNL